MNTPHWIIDHIGIAVRDLEQAERHYLSATNSKITLREQLDEQGVKLVFIDTGSAKIELLASLRADSTLARFLEKRGPGLHHVCYRVQDIRQELKRLSAMGIRLIDEHPRAGAGGTRIAFLHPSSFLGTLTELCEYPES